MLTTGHWWQLLVRHAGFVEQSLPERILIALFDLAAKFGLKDDRGTILNLRLTHQDIAELVDASRPKVTTYLRSLVANGALIQETRRIIIRPEKLEAIFSLNYA
jgi:CRP/FNR family transcriptional regulator, cyclic AMP receptor protein